MSRFLRGGDVVKGHCDQRFLAVKKQFLENMMESSPKELGAALAVYLDGQLVVDIWGGYRDPQRLKVWQRDTPVCVFSCTKGVVSILAMRLVQAGLLDYTARVSTYWPEYGCHGKEDTTVGQLLSHQAGLPVLTASLVPGGIWRWGGVSNALAVSEPVWAPGESHGYHALTWGYLVGALLERAAGRPLNVLLQQEVCGPLGSNFSFGVSTESSSGPAMLVGLSSEDGFAGSPEERSRDVLPLDTMTRLDEGTLLTPAAANSDCWRAALSPGANGHCSAIDLANIYQGLISSGNHYVEQSIIVEATTVQASGADVVLGVESAYGMGFQLPSRDITPGGGFSDRCWGHKGIYGATGFVDPEYDIAVAYVMNRCGDRQGDERSSKLLASIYDCL